MEVPNVAVLICKYPEKKFSLTYSLYNDLAKSTDSNKKINSITMSDARLRDNDVIAWRKREKGYHFPGNRMIGHI